MPQELTICSAAHGDMLAHLAANAEDEACGLLLGMGRRAARFQPIANVAAEPRCRYEMDPRQLIAAMKALRASGEALLGIVHSHPQGPAEPSPMDIAQASYPDAVYVIVSLKTPAQPQVRGWRLRPGGAPVEVHLRVAGDR